MMKSNFNLRNLNWNWEEIPAKINYIPISRLGVVSGFTDRPVKSFDCWVPEFTEQYMYCLDVLDDEYTRWEFSLRVRPGHEKR